MKKSILLPLVGLIVIVVVLAIFTPTKISISPNGVDTGSTTPVGTSPKIPAGEAPYGGVLVKTTYTNATADLIQVTLPTPDAVVGKDFSVIGKARGGWFFEASFPVEVLDKNCKSLAVSVAQPLNGESWMTTNFVNFKADIKIPQTYIGPATLVLKKDNPSGLEEHDASISFPINIEY